MFAYTNPLSLACTSAPFWRRICTTLDLLYPAAKCKGVDLLPSLAWQLTLRGFSNCNNRSSFPDLAASKSSSFLYSPVSTGFVEISATSNAVFPSVFLMFTSAPCCSRVIHTSILPCQVQMKMKKLDTISIFSRWYQWQSYVSKRYKISTLIAASCKGVKFQLSLVFGLAPASKSNLTTSQCPKEHALCNGCRPPSSRAWIDAPADRRNSTTSFLPYPVRNF